MDDKRKFSRILFDAPAKLIQGDKTWNTKIMDMSLNGALVYEPTDFVNAEESITLCFNLPESDIEIHMYTELVHQKKGQLGLRCNFIDVESISHLKRMMELNLGDESLLHREIARFIDKHDQTLHPHYPYHAPSDIK